MKTLRIPLVGSLTNRNPNAAVSDAKDQRFVNGFPVVETNPITGKPSAWLHKRQGCTASSDVQASATGSYGAVVWTANSAAVAPAVFSYIKTGSTSTMFFNTAGSQIGSDVPTTNSCLSVEETDLSSVGTLTGMLTDSGTNLVEYWTYEEGGAWAQVTSAPIATTSSPICPAHAHMDGYPFVMREDGRLYHGDINTVSSWPAANFITANSFADSGVGCVRYRNMILGFGDYSAEFFYNAGNELGSVLSRIQNATLRIGAVRNTIGRGTAIRAVGNTVYWIGVNADTGARGIYRMNGMQPEKVSVSAVDNMIANGAIRSIVGAFSLLGMTHVAFGAGTTTLVCYCPDTKFWWYLTPGGSLNVTALLAAGDSSALSKSYFATVTNAKVYTFNPNSPVWQDATSTYALTVQTDNLDVGTRMKKFWKSVSIIGDDSAAEWNISYSDDDYATSSVARAVVPNAKLTRLGSSRRRSWTATHSSNAVSRAQRIEIEYDESLS